MRLYLETGHLVCFSSDILQMRIIQISKGEIINVIHWSIKSPPPPNATTTTCSYDFCGFPPGCGDSVADFWGWDAHEARLRCPDDVWVVICRKMKYQEGP